MLGSRSCGVLTVLLWVAGCGAPQVDVGPPDPDPVVGVQCRQDKDCELGRRCVDARCVIGDPAPDASLWFCTDDTQCPKAEACLKSTGKCVSIFKDEPVSIDAGQVVECLDGQFQSCGTSKLGECRLGQSTCIYEKGQWKFGPCMGSVDPVAEVCDGKDNDCDGLVDEALPSVTCGVAACQRTVPSCVDGKASLCEPLPGSPEVCNGIDDDCDGKVDEELAPISCGVGACGRSIAACASGTTQVCTPGTPTSESCNAIDDDCDGDVDEGLGQKSCGVGACARVVDACVAGKSQTCAPGAPSAETCNGIDDDCDGLVDEGLAPLSCGLGTCARTVAACAGGAPQMCTPGTPSAETCDGLDNDCDGFADEDLGTVSCGVGACARTIPSCAGGAPASCAPGAPSAETCNGIDDDCDGQVDEGQPQVTCGLGVCQRTMASCVAGAPQACVPGVGSAEKCNGLDDNCDGRTDEGCQCIDGQVRSCYSGPSGTVGVGLCAAGSQTCVNGAWASCVGQVLPKSEVCNGSDDNCSGQTDEGLGSTTCGVGACRVTSANCVGGVSKSCVPGAPSTEVCDGVDNDCDGSTDEKLGAVSCGVGACAKTVTACVGGVPQACVPGQPRTEVCDGVDNDCDGAVDEGLGSLSCGVGACARTVAACVNGTAQRCTAGTPSAEVCDGIDNDCDGNVDENLGSLNCGTGTCARTVAACVSGSANVCTPGSPGVETCNSLDDDCDGVKDNGVCPPGGTCPGAQTVDPNTTVTLNTSASSPVGRAVTCAWSVDNRPSTSNGAFTNPTSCTSARYFADVVGTHVLRFTVTDSLGVTTSCVTTVTVKPKGDLWVELTWDRNNDMDLHLLHPSAGNSHLPASWLTTPYDCSFRNKTPSWDAVGTADDPSLDRDDIPGKGPENIRINVPSTSHDYVVGVHMYSYAASPNTVTATVKVYCGGTLSTTVTRAFKKNREAWVVGTVRFQPGATCTWVDDGFTLVVP